MDSALVHCTYYGTMVPKSTHILDILFFLLPHERILRLTDKHFVASNYIPDFLKK